MRFKDPPTTPRPNIRPAARGSFPLWLLWRFWTFRRAARTSMLFPYPVDSPPKSQWQRDYEAALALLDELFPGAM